MKYYLRWSSTSRICLLWSLNIKGLDGFRICLNELGLRSSTYDDLGYYTFEGDCRKNRVVSNTKIKCWEI